MNEITEILKVTMIRTDRLRASPTQPRKHFNQEKHAELTQSMQQHGFTLSALTVRQIISPESFPVFEIVIGERRWRAAKEAKILEVPCFVRVLTNLEVIEVQLVENLNRDDLTIIEEAEGYKNLLELRDEDKKPLHTIDSIAVRIGRSRDTIERRLALCALDVDTRAEVESNRLPPITAYLIARIPDATRRTQAAKEILHPQMEEGPLSFRRAADYIWKHFMRDLRKATFDLSDEKLLPVQKDTEGFRTMGGACVGCPFKTSSGVEGETVSKQRQNSCLNPACFEKKEDAEWERWQARETDPARHRRALSRAENATIFSQEYADHLAFNSPYVNLGQYPAGTELRPGIEAPGTWRAMTKGAELEIIVVRDRNGKTHELTKRESAIEAARTLNDHDVFKENDSRDRKEKETRKALGLIPPADLEPKAIAEWLNHPATQEEIKDHRKKEEKRRTENEALQKTTIFNCLRALHEKAKLNTAFLRKFALAYFEQRNGAHELLLKRHKLPIAADISKNVAKWRDADLIAFLVELVVTDGGFNFDLDDDDRSWFKLFGVDYRAEEKRLAKLDAGFKKSDGKALGKATRKKR